MKHRSPNARCSGANPCKRRLCLEVIVIDCGWVVCVFIWGEGGPRDIFLSRVQRGDGGHPPCRDVTNKMAVRDWWSLVT